MNTTSVSVTLEADVGTIEIAGELDESAALATERAMNKLFAYFQYEGIVLRINSPGGQLVSLSHILQFVEHWRSRGREVHTEATFQAASAAALLLALGEVGTRTVQRHTSVLFHHTRVAGAGSAITAGSADQIASVLRRTDLGILKRVVTHAIDGHGSLILLCQEGLARCEMLRQNAAEIAADLDDDVPSGRSTRWLTATSSVYQECAKKGSAMPYQRLLAKRLEHDTPMKIIEAYALMMIDRVYGMPRITSKPRVNSINDVPPLRLAA
jgi:ATP-dependent protease ClpP protease subunit